MSTVISIICALLFSYPLYTEYKRDKKAYQLLLIIIMFLTVILKPLVSGISQTLDTVLNGILIILGIAMIYSIFKYSRESKARQKKEEA